MNIVWTSSKIDGLYQSIYDDLKYGTEGASEGGREAGLLLMLFCVHHKSSEATYAIWGRGRMQLSLDQGSLAKYRCHQTRPGSVRIFMGKIASAEALMTNPASSNVTQHDGD